MPPLLLRTVRQNNWFKDAAKPWLDQGDVPADPVGDLKTNDQTLSVWEIEPNRSNLERVVRAVALGRLDKNGNVSHTGYVLFDASVLEAHQIGYEVNPGGTPDKVANASWHRDLVNLSGRKLIALTREILETGESATILKDRLKELIKQGVEAKELPAKFAMQD